MSKEAMKKALAALPAPVQQGGLEMVDDEGENQAVRMFLALYGGQYGITAEQMRKHLKMAGFDNAWPEWANSHNGHLTKAGAQLWIRHLFALAEQPAQQEPVAWRVKVETTFRDGSVNIGYQVRNEKMSRHDEPLYTSPPAQRTWVGLTDEEIEKLVTDAGFTRSDLLMLGACIDQVARLVEAKLKEKNTHEDRN